jgi:hypothetical protein
MTWIPDTEDKGDLLVSALGALLAGAVAISLSARSKTVQSALRKSELLSTALIPGSLALGITLGHKLYENLEDHFEAKRLLGG